jgi:hypothetical protein
MVPSPLGIKAELVRLVLSSQRTRVTPPTNARWFSSIDDKDLNLDSSKIHNFVYHRI